MLGVAALVEILAYYIPGVDNLLDVLPLPCRRRGRHSGLGGGDHGPAADAENGRRRSSPAAAGGLTQGVTALLRAKSTVITAGVGNPVIATAELGGSLLVSLRACGPLIDALLVVIVFVAGDAADQAHRTKRELIEHRLTKARPLGGLAPAYG
jgi:hypothetical protein